MSARIFSTMPTRRKVPMCGFATNRISSGAPALTNSFSTLRVRCRGSLICVHSLPSENVPAPPSPNCTFDSGVEHALAPQAPGVLGALAHLLAALEDERAQAHLRQDQRGKDAAGPEADDHRARARRGVEVGRRMADEAVARVGRRANVRVALEAREQRLFVDPVGQFAIDRVREHHRALLARIPGAPEDREARADRRHAGPAAPRWRRAAQPRRGPAAVEAR